MYNNKVNFFFKLYEKDKIQTNYLGVIYILLHSSLDVLFYVICKYKNTHISSFIQEVFFVLTYNAQAFIFLVIIYSLKCIINRNYIASIKKLIDINRSYTYHYFIMSLFSVAGFIIFLYGLNNIIIANAMSLKYIEQILWVIVGTTILKERLTVNQVIGIMFSFLGIFIIIISSINSNENIYIHLLPVVAAICWTISSNFGKYIVQKQTNIIIHMIRYYMFHLIVITLFVLFVYYLIPIDTVIRIYWKSYEFIIHIFSMLFFYQALKITPISLLAPFVYIKLIISAIIGYIIFLDRYELLLLLAYTLILLGGIQTLVNINTKK